jgi:hypothetical protein
VLRLSLLHAPLSPPHSPTSLACTRHGEFHRRATAIGTAISVPPTSCG